MSWIRNLIKTYDFCESLIGKIDTSAGKTNGSVVLLPLFHLVNNASLEIYIDQDGNFIRAERIPKYDQATVCPETEDSGSRGAGIYPKPLFDKLYYVAGDYDEYSQHFKKNSKKPEKKKRAYFEKYIKNLEEWVNSDYSCDKIKSIYRYLKKEQVLQDLIKVDKLEKNDDFVRFVVESPGSMNEKVWEDIEVRESFIKYTLNKSTNIGICYATGEEMPLAKKLPSKIRSVDDMTKIISSNNKGGLVFRGRFAKPEQAVGIGYVASEKAHNALRWLIAKQGYTNDSESIVFWGNKKIEVATPNDTPLAIVYEKKETINTLEKYADKVNSLMEGYKTELRDEEVSMISVDSANGSKKGRLSITYYNEMSGADYIDKLRKWYEECSWELFGEKNDNQFYYMGTPTPKDIAYAAYGVKRNKALTISNPKLQKKCIDRILSCIVEDRKLPLDILKSAVNNASNPQRFIDKRDTSKWNFILGVTCALIRKHNIDYKKGEYSVMLEEDKYRKDRDYLFGMLLAILDDVENSYYYRAQMDSRETNASKLWNIYSRYPARTFEEIRRKLQPYLAKTSKPIRENQSKKIEHILGCLRDIDGFNNKSLNENYLLGYYCEKAAIRENRKKSKKEEE